MSKITLPHNWKPRAYQEPLWEYLANGGKRAVAVWHRRAGKDDLCLHFTACAAHKRVGSYWHMLPEKEQARKAIWNMINPHTGLRRIDEAFPKEMRRKTNDQEMFIEFLNGSTWQAVGSDNYDSLVGTSPAGITMSEFAVANPSAWGYFSPILKENDGWALFISTPRGKNHLKKLYDYAKTADGWFAQILRADTDTDVFTEEQLRDELSEKIGIYGDELGLALFEQEYLVSFEAAIPGSIWGDSLRIIADSGRICAVPHTPGYPVFTGWDLGYDDDTTCWYYQVIGDSINVINYHDSRFKDVPWECQQLYNRHVQLGYEYGINWLPHDAKPRTKAAGGRPILQQFIEWNDEHGDKIGRFAIAPKLDVQEGIQAARATFKYCKFDAELCLDGIEHLKSYSREYDHEKNMFSSTPKHDWHSHAADGWRTVSVTWRRSKAATQEPSFAQKIMAGNVHALNFGQIKDAHLRRMRAAREEM